MGHPDAAGTAKGGRRGEFVPVQPRDAFLAERLVGLVLGHLAYPAREHPAAPDELDIFGRLEARPDAVLP